MEKKINIAEILKNKPEGTKLWTDMFGSVMLYVVTDACDAFQVKHHNKEPWFDKDGKLYKEGVLCIYPSKSMRDWEKFSWKKGDVLISDCGFMCIFKEWASDDYTKFNGCYFDGMPNTETAKYSKLDNNIAYGYIRDIENKCGGKLNLETLEIEKSEFKDGDIIKMTWDKYSAMVIFWEYSNFGKGFDSHVFFNIKTKIIEYNIHGHILQDTILRLATEEEKKQLFSALEKEGKAWDAGKKMIIDLKQKVEFKPFDKVVVRCSEADRWSIDFFSYKAPNGYICTGDAWFGYCLPYNEETAKLIGTTKNMEV